VKYSTLGFVHEYYISYIDCHWFPQGFWGGR